MWRLPNAPSVSDDSQSEGQWWSWWLVVAAERRARARGADVTEHALREHSRHGRKSEGDHAAGSDAQGDRGGNRRLKRREVRSSRVACEGVRKRTDRVGGGASLQVSFTRRLGCWLWERAVRDGFGWCRQKGSERARVKRVNEQLTTGQAGALVLRGSPSTRDYPPTA